MKFLKSLIGLALAATTAGAAETPLVVDAAQSRVEIVVKATVDSFTGNLAAYDAAILVDPAAERITGARFAFKFADVKTGNEDRDAQMLEWAEAPKHPDGVFALSSLERDAAGATTAKGTLTLHGVAKEISFPVSVTHEAGRYAIDGEALLDTRDFGLPIIRKFLLLKVDPQVAVRFHLQGDVPVKN